MVVESETEQDSSSCLTHRGCMTPSLTSLSTAQADGIIGQALIFPPSQPHSNTKFSYVIFPLFEFTWGQINCRAENPKARLLPASQDPVWTNMGPLLQGSRVGGQIWMPISLGYWRKPCSDKSQLPQKIHQCFLPATHCTKKGQWCNEKDLIHEAPGASEGNSHKAMWADNTAIRHVNKASLCKENSQELTGASLSVSGCQFPHLPMCIAKPWFPHQDNWDHNGTSSLSCC
jgi:hypothetical protein